MDEGEAWYCLICGGPFCDADVEVAGDGNPVDPLVYDNDVISKEETRWT